MLLKHFGVPAGEVATAGRQFPITARVDIQSAIEDLLRNRPETKLLGVLSPNHHEPPALAHILVAGHFPINEGPLQYDEIDIGELLPVRCLRNGLWLSRDNGLPFAVMMTPGGRFGLRSGVQVEIGIPVGERGAQFSQELFRNLELLVAKGRTYRGRIISLEGHIDPMGGGSLVKVHRLAKVAREDVILPGRTLALLDRNVTGFMQAREQLGAAVSGQKGTAILWPARYGQDVHDSLSGLAATQSHYVAGNSRTSAATRRILPLGTFSATFPNGHRGRGSDRPRTHAYAWHGRDASEPVAE